MCVIAVYKKGLDLNKKELKECFRVNHDGAGMMFQQGDHVHIEKGFMTFDDFWAMARTVPKDVDRVFHFRIATSGKVSGACCHPFPITDNYKEMALVSANSTSAFAHNGILTEFTPKGGMSSKQSDTMVFDKEILSRLGERLTEAVTIDLLELYTTSRFAFMTPDKTVTSGAFVQSRDSKALYSNSSYKPYVYQSSWDTCGCGYDYTGYSYKNNKKGASTNSVASVVNYKKNKKKAKELTVNEYESYGIIKVSGTAINQKDLDKIAAAFETKYDILVQDNIPTEDGDILFTFYEDDCSSMVPEGTIEVKIEQGITRLLPFKQI